MWIEKTFLDIFEFSFELVICRYASSHFFVGALRVDDGEKEARSLK